FTLKEHGGSFSLFVETLSESWVPVPSTSALYPHDLRVTDSKGAAVAMPVELRDSILHVRLPKGRFQIDGELQWDSELHQIPVPPAVGLVEVFPQGEKKAARVRRENDTVSLAREEESRSAESASLSVMRRIIDGSPLQIETLLRLR